MDSVISAPTTINAGAVAYPGIAAAKGAQNAASRISPRQIHVAEPGPSTCRDSRGALDVAGHRRRSGQRAENGAHGVGHQRSANPRNLSVFDESALLANSHQRAHVVEQINKEKHKNNLE